MSRILNKDGPASVEMSRSLVYGGESVLILASLDECSRPPEGPIARGAGQIGACPVFVAVTPSLILTG